MNFNFSHNLSVLKIWGKQHASFSSITYDSRKVTPGAAFVCVSGENHDGHVFIEDAIFKGATVLAGENKGFLDDASQRYPNLTFLHVQDARRFLAELSISFYKNIHKKITTVGVTGTNGKTTVAAYVKSLMNLLGIPSGSIGTNGVSSSRGKITFEQSTPTTPEACDLHFIFNKLHEQNDQLAVMEVSSVAIEQQRVAGIHFDVAIHTNLTPEHLEFHHTFENYKDAKLKLFQQAKRAVVNLDDKGMGAEIIAGFGGDLLTYSLDRHSAADVKASNIRVSNDGTTFELIFKDESYIVRAPVIGNYNVANLLSAVCTALHLGHPMANILLALPKIEGPEGRFEVLHEYGGRKIILDYAHTPAALENLLYEVKKLSYKRLIVMITGIGIRDKSKMPKMAEIIEKQADEIVVSVDHPGFTDPFEIIGHVMEGFENRFAPNIHTEPTRFEGVRTALSLSDENDLILLTSGCINGAQLIKGVKVPHSDKEIIRNYFENEVVGAELDYLQA